MRNYRSSDDDNARWDGFPFRDGDIVISTRSKSGTTWMQMICLLLVFQTPELPAPLGELSPWLDHLVEPRDVVWRRLAAQRRRRVIKSHTPLDGLPLDPRATFIVVARHPLDMAVSLYHQGDNIDRARLAELTGSATVAPGPRPRPALHDWLVEWIERDVRPEDELDSLPGVMHHLGDAWSRRDAGNVVLAHYDSLQADLEGEMRSLADRLGIAVEPETWPALVEAAGFRSMRERARTLLPDRRGVLKDAGAFFREGRSGAGAELLTSAEREAYESRAAELAPPDLLAWLHRRPYDGAAAKKASTS